jgi:hypothetical protein
MAEGREFSKRVFMPSSNVQLAAVFEGKSAEAYTHRFLPRLDS